MPVTKQAIKRARQADVRAGRNRQSLSSMKSMIKLFLGYVQKKEVEKATRIFPRVASIIDMCAKKHLIHKKNAANKKSRLQKILTNIDKVVVKAEKAPKAAKAKSTEAPKAKA